MKGGRIVMRVVLPPLLLLTITLLLSTILHYNHTKASSSPPPPIIYLKHEISQMTVVCDESKCGNWDRGYLRYETVGGVFLQDEEVVDPGVFDFTTTNFGLINRTYPTDAQFDPEGKKSQWERFGAYVKSLNDEAGEGVGGFKVLFMGRHGDGVHNAAEAFYGTPAWDCYWSEQDGNATVTWADAHLTPLGISQAQKASNFWLHEIQTQNIPLPQTYYTSPLYRCLQTSNITFSTLPLPPSRPFIPTIKELFREGISGHTCDRRSNRTFIAGSFPGYRIEQGFSEFDLLWMFDNGESQTSQDARSKRVLDDVFFTDSSIYISITSHSGEIASILGVLNHQPFALNTGAVIPVLVKAVVIRGGEGPTTTISPWTTLETCSVAPATATSVTSASATSTVTG